MTKWCRDTERRAQPEIRRVEVVGRRQTIDGQPCPDHVEVEFGPVQDVR